MFQTKVVQKMKTHIVRPIFFFLSFKIMWKNMIQPDRPQMIIYYCIRPNAGLLRQEYTNTHIHTHSEYVIRISFTRQQWLCEHHSLLWTILPVLFVCVVLTLKYLIFRVLRNRVLKRIAKTKRKQTAGGVPKYAKYH